MKHKHIFSTLPLAGALLLLGGTALWQYGESLDQRLFEALKLSPADPLALLAAGLSRLGGLAILGPVALGVALYLLLRRRRSEALWLFLTIASGRLMIEALKLGIAKARPPVSDHLVLVTSYSFPSSHSAGSMLTCLAFAMLFAARRPTMLVLAVAVACAIGWSRIALGVHWPSDVLAGLGFGMLWAGLARHWLNPSRFPGD